MATFNVTTTVDENNGTGLLSLREAVITANGAVGDDTIVLVGGETYQLSLTGANEDKSLTGDLDILGVGGGITILGQPDNKATINGGGIDGVLDVDNSGSLSLKDIVITGGNSTAGISSSGGLALESVTVTGNSGIGISSAGTTIVNSIISNNGGRGIDNSGNLTITNSSIIGNKKGGIDNSDGISTITNSIINNNIASSSGGGITQSGSTSSLTVIDSTISNNTAGTGGGIYISGGTVDIINSTISSNIAKSGGVGGIYQSGSKSLKIVNSTISGNLATGTSGNGGGIRSADPLTVENSTISNNTASNGGGMYVTDVVNVNNSTITSNDAGQGSGVVISTSAAGSFSNSIVAGNKQNLDISNLSNSLTSQGNNLIGNAITLELVFNKTGDKVGSIATPLDPMLGPLQNNGGITATHALLAGSPAINAGNSTLIKDQRGLGRNGLPDIGAFEFDGINDTIPPTVVGLTPTDEGTGVLTNANLVINFSEPVKKGTGNISIKKLSDNSLVTNIDVNGPVNVISGNQLTINPSADLEANTAYYVEIANGVIKDLFDNNYAGITGNTAWNFQTAAPPDTIAPLASSFTPVDNATGVTLASDLSINFSEPIQKGVGSLLIKKVADNSVVETIDVAAANITVNGTQLNINPTADLAENTGYYVEIANGAIKDVEVMIHSLLMLAMIV